MGLRERYRKLHREYLEAGGAEFDTQDIDQAAISYAYNTCGVEGNTLTLGETETVLVTDKVISGKSLHEHIEIKDAHKAFKKMFEFIREDFEMSESLAMTFHQLNTRGWLKEEWSGKYKTISNRVGGRSTPYPEKAKPLFKKVFEQLDEIEDPFERAVKLHLDTVLIHPWQDGNGRTARLMMNFELVKNGHGHLQIAKTQKDEYFRAIRESTNQKSPGPFIAYMYEVALQTYEKKIDFLNRRNRSIGDEDTWTLNEPVAFYGK